MTPNLVAALLGAATGVRSMSGLAALTMMHVDRRGRRTETGSLLGRAPLRALVRASAAAEAVADKTLPLPARTEPLPLAGRMLLGAAVGLAVSELTRSPAARSILIGAGTAALTAVAATRLRARATDGGAPDALIGLAEDAAVVALAGLAIRSR